MEIKNQNKKVFNSDKLKLLTSNLPEVFLIVTFTFGSTLLYEPEKFATADKSPSDILIFLYVKI